VNTEGGTSLDQVFRLSPDPYEAFEDREPKLWQGLERDLLELCRGRVERVHGIEVPEKDDATPRELACLAFAEKFAAGVHSISDEDVAAMSRHLSPAEIVALCEALAIFDGMTRFRPLLDVAA
jgi:hypothetical protein